MGWEGGMSFKREWRKNSSNRFPHSVYYRLSPPFCQQNLSMYCELSTPLQSSKWCCSQMLLCAAEALPSLWWTTGIGNWFFHSRNSNPAAVSKLQWPSHGWTLFFLFFPRVVGVKEKAPVLPEHFQYKPIGKSSRWSHSVLCTAGAGGAKLSLEGAEEARALLPAEELLGRGGREGGVSQLYEIFTVFC